MADDNVIPFPGVLPGADWPPERWAAIWAASDAEAVRRRPAARTMGGVAGGVTR